MLRHYTTLFFCTLKKNEHVFFRTFLTNNFPKTYFIQRTIIVNHVNQTNRSSDNQRIKVNCLNCDSSDDHDGLWFGISPLSKFPLVINLNDLCTPFKNSCNRVPFTFFEPWLHWRRWIRWKKHFKFILFIFFSVIMVQKQNEQLLNENLFFMGSHLDYCI